MTSFFNLKKQHWVFLIVSLILLISTLFYYYRGYATSMDWIISTESELERVVALEFNKGPFALEVFGDRVVLTEAFQGGPMDLGVPYALAFAWIIWAGFAVLLTWSSFLGRYAWLIFSALFILFVVRLNLQDLLGWSNSVLLIILLLPLGTTFLFQAFFTRRPFWVRWLVIMGVSWPIVYLAPVTVADFTFYFFTQATLDLGIVLLIMLLLISEELLFGLVYLLTMSKGSTNNHQHFLILGGLYVLNLLGHYLETHGILPFAFSFFDPFLLTTFSFVLAFFTLPAKLPLMNNDGRVHPRSLLFGLGLIGFGFLSLGAAKGYDALGYAFDYLALYVHLAVGALFFFYIVLNFLTPMAAGHQAYKIIYTPQPFHYFTARIGGFIAIMALYFSSGGSILSHLTAVSYSFEGDRQMMLGHEALAASYYKGASNEAYHSHYPNYQLGMQAWRKEKTFDARYLFEQAADRLPSPQSHANAGALLKRFDKNRAVVQLEEGLLTTSGGDQELKNNLGLIYKESAKTARALAFFDPAAGIPMRVNYWAVVDSPSNETLNQTIDQADVHTATNILGRFGSLLEAMPFPTSLVDEAPAFSKEAFWMNALFSFQDSSLQVAVDTHLVQSQQVIFPELKNALARNLFTAGRTKRAMQLYAQMIDAAPPTRRAELQLELGQLLLYAEAPELAFEYFNSPNVRQLDGSATYRMVALLESGRWTEAESPENLSSLDADFLTGMQKVLEVIQRAKMPDVGEDRYIWLYYNGSNLSFRELQLFLKSVPESARTSLLNKWKADWLNRRTSESWQEYQPLFDSTPDLLNLPPGLTAMKAQSNPFDELAVLAVWRDLKEKDEVDSYNFIVDMLQYNPYPLGLLKAAAHNAAEINMIDYADPYLRKLSARMPENEFASFTSELQAIIDQFNDENWLEISDEIQ